MANDFEVSVDVAAPAAAVWAVVGDPARVTDWFGAVASCTMDGDVRRATMGNGAELVERIVDHDDAARRYSYEVLSGIPGLTSHRATIRVEETPDGSRLHWRQTGESEIEGYDMERRLSPVMTSALESVRDRCEASAAG